MDLDAGVWIGVGPWVFKSPSGDGHKPGGDVRVETDMDVIVRIVIGQGDGTDLAAVVNGDHCGLYLGVAQGLVADTVHAPSPGKLDHLARCLGALTDKTRRIRCKAFGENQARPIAEGRDCFGAQALERRSVDVSKRPDDVHGFWRCIGRPKITCKEDGAQFKGLKGRGQGCAEWADPLAIGTLNHKNRGRETLGVNLD